MNEMLLVLIPKMDNPETVKQLRPISLCNVSYKIVTKAMPNHLNKFLPNIIGPIKIDLFPKCKLRIIF